METIKIFDCPTEVKDFEYKANLMGLTIEQKVEALNSAYNPFGVFFRLYTREKRVDFCKYETVACVNILITNREMKSFEVPPLDCYDMDNLISLEDVFGSYFEQYLSHIGVGSYNRFNYNRKPYQLKTIKFTENFTQKVNLSSSWLHSFERLFIWNDMYYRNGDTVPKKDRLLFIRYSDGRKTKSYNF